MDCSVEMIGVLRPKAEKVARVRKHPSRTLSWLPYHALTGVSQVRQLCSQLAREVVKRKDGCQVYNVYVQKKSKDIPSVMLHKKCFEIPVEAGG